MNNATKSDLDTIASMVTSLVTSALATNSDREQRLESGDGTRSDGNFDGNSAHQKVRTRTGRGFHATVL